MTNPPKSFGSGDRVSVFHRNVDFPYQPFGLRTVEVDRQEPVRQFRAVHPHAVGEHEGPLELPRGDAAMDEVALARPRAGVRERPAGSPRS